MAYDPELAERLRAALSEDPVGIREQKMFGGICWMLDGNMLCGVGTGRYMFRVGKDRTEEALNRPGASVMDITGRPMRGLVWVDAPTAHASGLEEWIEFAAVFVRTLPAK